MTFRNLINDLNLTDHLNDEVVQITAKEIFTSCKDLLGATCGYISLLSEDGKENKALYADPGSLIDRVDPTLPMPIRGLRDIAYKKGKPVFQNCFPDSQWMKNIPKGHILIKNVLFAPLIINNSTIGLIGLGNKEGGFTDFDANVAASFGRLVAVTFNNMNIMQKLRTQEELFHSVVETASNAIICLDAQGRIAYWNNAALKIFGYSGDEVLGRSINLIIPESIHATHEKALREAITGDRLKHFGKIIPVNGLKKDGTCFPLEVSIAKWRNRDQAYFTAILRDVTERILMEQSLREKDEQIRSAFEYAAVGMIIISLDGNFIKANYSFCDMVGYSFEELKGKKCNEITHPDNSAEEVLLTKKLFSGEINSYQIEKRYKSKTGQTIWVSAHVSMAYTENETRYLVAQVRDITERKEAERELLRATEELKRTNRDLIKINNYKSDFLANMSHELRTPLTAILALSGEMLTQRNGTLNNVQLKYMTNVRNSGEKLLTLIDELLELSKIDSGRIFLNFSEVCVGLITEEVIQVLKPLANQKSIKINSHIKDTVNIIADSNKVRQVIMNLLGNAIKFSPPKSEIMIEVVNRSFPEKGIVLKVTDSGPGVPPDEQELIFEPFYQVDHGINRKYQGTGLGLAMVKKIVDLHLGTVSVENLPSGNGAVFTVFWPTHPCFEEDLD